MPEARPPLFASDWLVGAPYDDVPMGVLKTGKESEVHLLARIGPERMSLIAEKRFKERRSRGFRNDYRYAGVWGAGGRREARAIRNRTRFGQQAIQARWIDHEWTTLTRLYEAGVTVPPPVEQVADGYRMAFVGDGDRAAPRLTEIDLDRETARLVWREVQLDPVKDWPIHVDFQRIGAGARIRVNVPVRFINEGLSPGLKRGGVLNVVRHEIELRCAVDAIPRTIVIDLEGLDIGDSIHISEVKLPANVRPTIERDFTVASVAAPSAVRAEALEAQAAAQAAAAAPEVPVAPGAVPGAAPTPAAPGAAPAPAAPEKKE